MQHGNISLPSKPYIVAEAENWLIVFKPRGMHSSANGKDTQNSLTRWLADTLPQVRLVKGFSDSDYGLLHRLDLDTAGLLLIAKTQGFFDKHASTENANITKYYFFNVEPNTTGLSGSMPALNHPEDCAREAWVEILQNADNASILRYFPRSICSVFRAFGQGRRQVACGQPALITASKKQWTHEAYSTAIDSAEIAGTRLTFQVHLTRGFRHQIRAHFAWYGLPLGGDPLYNPRCRNTSCNEALSLTASALDFSDIDGNRCHISLFDTSV